MSLSTLKSVYKEQDDGIFSCLSRPTVIIQFQTLTSKLMEQSFALYGLCPFLTKQMVLGVAWVYLLSLIPLLFVSVMDLRTWSYLQQYQPLPSASRGCTSRCPSRWHSAPLTVFSHRKIHPKNVKTLCERKGKFLIHYCANKHAE